MNQSILKFKKRYRIPSSRANWCDYSGNGLFFITICSSKRENIFGQINNKEMVISPIGEIIQKEWLKSFEIRQELSCDAFVIMPNHIHAIIRKDNKIEESNLNYVETHGGASPNFKHHDIQIHGIELNDLNPNNFEHQEECNIKKESETKKIAYRQPKSISSFVACFKSKATIEINKYRNITNKFEKEAYPIWQSRFYDHVIRNYSEYIRVLNYIKTNIENWEEDKMYNE